MNPDISGTEYQQGEQSGYDSVKEYVKIRDGNKCHYSKSMADIQCSCKLTIDHIKARSKGGTDRPANLVCSCDAHNEVREI